MSLRIRKNCLYYSLLCGFLLLFQAANGQYNFSAADTWLQKNTSAMGGRSVLMVFHDGRIVYSKSVNALNMKQKMIGRAVARRTGKSKEDVLADFSPERKIPVASCSKWLSAALVMTFIDDGKIKLSDTVGKFLPVLAVAGKGKITIRDCLAHLTGIKSGDIKESRAGFETAKTMDEAMTYVAGLPMESAPGETFHYSSIGLQIAAAVIEKISGKDFRTLFSERIAIPCEMSNTDFGTAAIPIAAGSASSTPADYLRFLQMILNGGNYNGRQILQKSTVALMQYNYAAGKGVIYTPPEAGNWGYGLGEWTTDSATATKRSETVTSPGLFGTMPWVKVSKNYAAVLFTFYAGSEGRHERYLELIKLIDEAITNGTR